MLRIELNLCIGETFTQVHFKLKTTHSGVTSFTLQRRWLEKSTYFIPKNIKTNTFTLEQTTIFKAMKYMYVNHWNNPKIVHKISQSDSCSRWNYIG